MDFQIREKEIFETLRKLRNFEFTLIGGYAVNTYTLPRFSTDCDIVVSDKKNSEKIERNLISFGYKESRNKNETPYDGKFKRYEKKLKENFYISVDILIGGVLDRQTNSFFPAKWIFEKSRIRILRGKTIMEKLKLRIINIDALFVMKMISCRLTDIRDIFLLVASIENKEWIKKQITERYDFENRFKKLKKEITSGQFKDNLQGVFGVIDKNIFEKHLKLILEFGDRDETKIQTNNL